MFVSNIQRARPDAWGGVIQYAVVELINTSLLKGDVPNIHLPEMLWIFAPVMYTLSPPCVDPKSGDMR